MAKDFILEPAIVTNQGKLLLRGAGLELIIPKFFKVNDAQAEKEQYNDSDLNGVFGQPLFDTFQFLATTFDDLEGKRIEIAAPVILDNVLIEVNQDKNIVKTIVQGANGNVKEFINRDDYEINLTGLIVGKTAHQPPDIAFMNSLDALLNAPVTLPVTSNFLDFLKINSIVVKSFKFGQIEGTRNARIFSAVLWSDTPYEIKYTEVSRKVTTGFGTTI